MKFAIRNQEDFWSGLVFIGLGVLAIVVAQDYPMGSAMRMGPGYFPTWIGALLIALGALIAATALVLEGPKIGAFAWRPMVMLIAAFVYYGWAIDRLGLVLSLAGLIILSALAGKDYRIKELAIMTVLLIFGAWALFIYTLGLPYPLWWWR